MFKTNIQRGKKTEKCIEDKGRREAQKERSTERKKERKKEREEDIETVEHDLNFLFRFGKGNF